MNEIQLEQCIEEHGKDVYAFCSQLTRNVQEAEDLYQDTFLKAVELGGRIDYGKNPKGYLISIALRIWKNRKRKYAWRKRIAGASQLEEGAVGDRCFGQVYSPEDALLRQEVQVQVQKAVGNLDDKYRIPVYLYYGLQFSIDQIGKVMKVPQGTVKSRLHKARTLLRQELEVVLNER